MLSLIASAGALVLASVLASSFLPPVPLPLHCGACSFNSGEAFIHALPGESMPAGQWSFSLRSDWQQFDSFSDTQLLSYAAAGVLTHSSDRSLVLRVTWNPHVSWFLSVGLPLVPNLDGAQSDTSFRASTGIGWSL